MATNAPKHSILLFEDDAKIAGELQREIARHLGADLELLVFPLDKKPQSESGPYEDRLYDAAKASKYKNVVLIVTDRDLSTQAWGGLSEAAVTRTAQKLGLPVACYRQAKTQIEERLRRVPGDGQIELPSDYSERARKIALLARGFVQMDALIRPPEKGQKAGKTKARKRTSNIDDSTLGTPGNLLAGILGQSIAASHFDTYACGDQNAVAEILEMSRNDSAKINTDNQRRLIVALGVWLADLVMQYPGVLVNEVAAASYLNIHPIDFKKPAVREIFDAALYRDLPFADAEQPMWWRHILDDIVNEAGVSSGKVLCASRGIKRIRYCPCSVDATIAAGYYCMASGQPLSEENSSGRVSWFPAGADLARLTKATHRKLAPWIGS